MQSELKTISSTDTTGLLGNAPLMVGVLLLVDSLHFVFARLLVPYLPPSASAFFVLAVGTVETGLFLGLTGRIRFDVFRRHFRFFLAVGLLVAASTVLNYAAIAFIDPGTASLLGKTSVLFALGFSLFWLRERLNRRQLGGAAVAVAGVFIISFQPGDYLRLGSLMILGSALMYAFHAAIVKRHGQELDFANFFLFRVATTAGFLFLFAASQRALVWPSRQAWLILLATGTVDVMISRVLYYLVLRRLPMSFHAIILTLSPVVTILWSLFLFGERPALSGLLGGAAVLVGVAVVTLSRREQRGENSDRTAIYNRPGNL